MILRQSLLMIEQNKRASLYALVAKLFRERAMNPSFDKELAELDARTEECETRIQELTC